MERIAVPKKVGEGGLRDWVVSHWRRHRDAWGEGCVRGVGLKVNANAMDVLGMLQQEPGTGEGLFTCGTYIAGRLIPATCNTQRKKNTWNTSAEVLCIYTTRSEQEAEIEKHESEITSVFRTKWNTVFFFKDLIRPKRTLDFIYDSNGLEQYTTAYFQYVKFWLKRSEMWCGVCVPDLYSQ